MAAAAGSIVVGVDGSEEAARALRWAALMAKQRHEPVHVVYALAPLAAYYGAGLPASATAYDESVRSGEQIVAEAVRTAREVGGGEALVTSEMPNERPEPRLIELSHAARVLVLGSSGVGGFAGMLVGSTTGAVTAHAHCPVVVVRGRQDDAGFPTEGPVVVGLDGTRNERALAVAFEEAYWRRVPLVALHSWADRDLIAPYAPWLAAVDWPEVEQYEQRVLAQQTSGWHEKYPDVKVERVVVRGGPRRELLDRSAQAQLVVVGSRGRGGFAGLLLGSTSRALIHHAQCPVLVARTERSQ